MKTLLTCSLLGLLGCAALWYALAFRAWMRCLRSPLVSGMTDAQRAEFMTSMEYARLRNAVRRPMYVTTILGALLFVVMRLPF